MTASVDPLTIEQVPIDQLRPDPANPRRISDEELDALERSIRQFGFVQPVLARRQDGTVIGGHQRLVAARRLGLATVPVIWLDVPVEQARLLNLALNKISGSWDDALLARLLADLQAAPEVDLSLSGFGEDEIKDLLRSLETREKRERVESFDLDAALEEATRAPRTKPGELWALGEHRLLVGDSTKPEDVERVLAGRRAAMAFTDPPYNVSLGDHGGQQRGSRKRRIANDSMDPIAWEAFVRAWARTLLAFVDGALYVCMSSKEMPLVSRVLAEEGGHWSDTIIWAKDRFVLGRADYQRSYEPIWYGWREGASHHWCGNRDQGDVATRGPVHRLAPRSHRRSRLEFAVSSWLGPPARSNKPDRVRVYARSLERRQRRVLPPTSSGHLRNRPPGRRRIDGSRGGDDCDGPGRGACPARSAVRHRHPLTASLSISP